MRPFESFESSGEVVCVDEVIEVNGPLFMAAVVEAMDSGFLDSSVHTFDLSVGLGMVGLGESVLDVMSQTYPIKEVSSPAGRGAVAVLRQIGELDAVVGEHGMDAIGHGCGQRLEERRNRLHIGLAHEFREDELAGAIDGHEQVQLAFRSAHLG